MNSKLAIGLVFPIVYIIGYIYIGIRDQGFPEWDEPFSLKIVSFTGGALLIGSIGWLITQCSNM